MLSYTHFTLEERKYLQQLLSEGLSFRKIAEHLGRSPSSVSREVSRNRTKYKPKAIPNNPYWYNSWRAQTLSITRRRKHTRWALVPGSEEWEYILAGLRHFWSPEQICGRWHKDHPQEKALCVSTIYRYIHEKRFGKITKKSNLRRRGKLMLPRKSCYNSIQPDRIIPDWPTVIVKRKRIGDWEGDTVYGGVGKGLLVTLVDRKSRYLRMGLLKKRTAEGTRTVIEQLLQGYPVKSISLDNGSEFSEFHELEKDLSTLVYFAEPHKPWQRGTNENTNDIVRYFFPKGTDFLSVTEEDVRFVEYLINNRPRKCLGWSTPAEVLKNSVALA